MVGASVVLWPTQFVNEFYQFRFLRPNSEHSSAVKGNPPQNDLGLTIVADPGAERNIDLVFIHGLGGMSQTTWAYEGKSKCFWPKEWLPKERGMETARIMTWGYHAPSNPFSKGTTMNISRFASDLLNALLVNNAGRVSNLLFQTTGPNDSRFERYIRLSLCATAWED